MTYCPGSAQPQPSPPRNRRVWPWILAAPAAIVIVGCGNIGATTPAAGPATPTATRADTPPLTAAGPQTSFGDGTWVVGEDIQPGTYKSAGAQQGIFELCSVTTLAGDTSDSAIIDWVTANADEPVRIKVTGKVKAVKATGCEDFTKVD